MGCVHCLPFNYTLWWICVFCWPRYPSGPFWRPIGLAAGTQHSCVAICVLQGYVSRWQTTDSLSSSSFSVHITNSHTYQACRWLAFIYVQHHHQDRISFDTHASVQQIRLCHFSNKAKFVHTLHNVDTASTCTNTHTTHAHDGAH